MKKLNNTEMESVNGGFSLFGIDFSNPVTNNPDQEKAKDDPFMKNMQKMFGGSAGRDLAKIATKFGLVKVVNSIFGW